MAAGAPVEVDISKMEAGQLIRVAWRGKPVWILNRTPDVLATLKTLENELRDPLSNESEQPPSSKNPVRSIKPEFLLQWVMYSFRLLTYLSSGNRALLISVTIGKEGFLSVSWFLV